MAKKLTTFILIALVAGAILGLGLHYGVHNSYGADSAGAEAQLKTLAGYFSIVTTIFLRLIKMIIAPLVFATLVAGIAHMGDTAALGRVGGRAVGWFICASLVSLTLGLILGVPLLVFFVAGSPLSFELPQQGRFNLTGGLQIFPEFVALLIGLTTYTAGFIAEVVRAGILAVSKGQTEAAHALGLRPGPTLKLVVIPQAMRVIIPPLTSNYLNLTKNSSLAVAIGYPDLVQVFTGTVLNQTGQAVEVVAITMAVYLTISLVTSLFMNIYNKRMALVER